MDINYRKFISIVMWLLAIIIVFTCINTYYYVTGEKLGDLPAFHLDKDDVPIRITEDLLDVNNASLSDLMCITGIGEVLASRIIEARPFISMDQLLSINGIGDVRYQELRRCVTIVRHD